VAAKGGDPGVFTLNSAESDENTVDQSRAKSLPREAFDLDDESELRE
jgi:hypothetical protein